MVLRIADIGGGFLARIVDHGVGRPLPVRVPARGQQHRPAVKIELPRCRSGRSLPRQHRDQCGGRVVREVPVPQRVPLPAADDRVQRVILQQQHGLPGHPVRRRRAQRADPPRASGRSSRRSRRPLAGPAGTSPRVGEQLSQDPPCGLPYSATTPFRQQARRRHPGHGVGRLRDECGGLGPSRLLGHGRDRPATEPGRTMSTATSAAGTRDRDPRRRTAGNNHKPAARQVQHERPADSPHARHVYLSIYVPCFCSESFIRSQC